VRSLIFRTTIIAIFTSALFSLIASPAHATANPNLWCWSMQSGSVKGTFSMTPATPGNGTALPGTYTLTDFSVTSSTISGVYSGSISNGVYAFGNQHDYTIVWDGTQPTSWNRQNGYYTNGIGIDSGPQGSTTYIIFDTNYQLAEDNFVGYFYSQVTPTLNPADSNGLCPWDSAPTPSPTPTPSPSPISAGQESSLAQTGTPNGFFIAVLGLVALTVGVLTRRSGRKA
jgi:hypothetical protein